MSKVPKHLKKRIENQRDSVKKLIGLPVQPTKSLNDINHKVLKKVFPL
jgi:hypothetical protein